MKMINIKFIIHLLLYGFGSQGLQFHNFDARNLDDVQYRILDELICDFLHEPSYYQRRRSMNARRKKEDSEDDDDSSNSKSEDYIKTWFTNWNNHTVWPEFQEDGSVINMVQARPWGKPCGDPKQSDAPPGTCMLPQECEGEYRIYRGDIDCGHTQFVCCGIQMEIYALPSLETQSSSSEEYVKKYGKGDTGCMKSEVKKKFDKHMANRKKKFKDLINRILDEIRKLLNNEVKDKGKTMKQLRNTFKTMYKVLESRYKKKHKLFGKSFKDNLEGTDTLLKKFIKSMFTMNEYTMKNMSLREKVFSDVIKFSNKSLTLGNVLRMLDDIKEDAYRRQGLESGTIEIYAANDEDN